MNAIAPTNEEVIRVLENSLMDDHELICEARNELADALKVLLNPAIMGTDEFMAAQDHARWAMIWLYRLIRMRATAGADQ
jgi:hypothetical protein